MMKFNLRRETVALIERSPLSVTEIAAIVGVTPPAVYGFIKGRNMGVNTVQAIYDVLAKAERSNSKRAA